MLEHKMKLLLAMEEVHECVYPFVHL